MSLTYLHTDHLGAVVKATDENGGLVWDVERRPFGERVVGMGLVEVPLGFPGQYYDQETGNYYNYFRDYNPTTGRYLQSDPIGLEGGLNTYLYSLANPIMYSDHFRVRHRGC
jgi:RHS repeat-associated protein